MHAVGFAEGGRGKRIMSSRSAWVTHFKKITKREKQEFYYLLEVKGKRMAIFEQQLKTCTYKQHSLD